MSLLQKFAELSQEQVKERLIELKQKCINIDDFLNELLDEREQKILEEKQEIVRNLPEKSSRYIPIKVRKVLQKKFRNKCSAPNCTKDSEQIHPPSHKTSEDAVTERFLFCLKAITRLRCHLFVGSII